MHDRTVALRSLLHCSPPSTSPHVTEIAHGVEKARDTRKVLHFMLVVRVVDCTNDGLGGPYSHMHMRAAGSQLISNTTRLSVQQTQNRFLSPMSPPAYQSEFLPDPP